MSYKSPRYLSLPPPAPKWTHSILTASWNDMDELESLAATSSRSSGLTNALLTQCNKADTENNKKTVLGNPKESHFSAARTTATPTNSSNPPRTNTTHTRHNLGHYIYSQSLLNQERPPYHGKVIKAVNDITGEVEACAWLQYVPSPSVSASIPPSSPSSAAPAAVGGTDVGKNTDTKKTTPQPHAQRMETDNDLPKFINAIEWRKQENWRRARIADMLKTFRLDASREGYYLICNVSHSPTPPGFEAANALLARVKVMDRMRAIIVLPTEQHRWLFLQGPWRKAGEYGFFRFGQKAENPGAKKETEVGNGNGKGVELLEGWETVGMRTISAGLNEGKGGHRGQEGKSVQAGQKGQNEAKEKKEAKAEKPKKPTTRGLSWAQMERWEVDEEAKKERDAKEEKERRDWKEWGGDRLRKEGEERARRIGRREDEEAGGDRMEGGEVKAGWVVSW